MAGRSEQKKELAYLLYMQGLTHKEICERAAIGSNATLQRWINDGEWKEKRAAKEVSRGQLINKTLSQINKMLDQAIEKEEEINADKLSKLATLIEKLDKQDSPVVIMDVFMGFNNWLLARASTDQELTLEVIKVINKYEDLFVTEKLNS